MDSLQNEQFILPHLHILQLMNDEFSILKMATRIVRFAAISTTLESVIVINVMPCMICLLLNSHCYDMFVIQCVSLNNSCGTFNVECKSIDSFQTFPSTSIFLQSPIWSFLTKSLTGIMM